MIDKIVEIIVRYADIEPGEIKKESKLAEDLGLTSFAVMSLMGDFEDEFGITIDDTELIDIQTVGDIADYIQKMKKQG